MPKTAHPVQPVPDAQSTPRRRFPAPVRRPDDGTDGKPLFFSISEPRMCDLCALIRLQETSDDQASRLFFCRLNGSADAAGRVSTTVRAERQQTVERSRRNQRKSMRFQTRGPIGSNIESQAAKFPRGCGEGTPESARHVVSISVTAGRNSPNTQALRGPWNGPGIGAIGVHRSRGLSGPVEPGDAGVRAMPWKSDPRHPRHRCLRGMLFND